MKRDMDLCRQVLLKLEDAPPGRGFINPFEIEGQTDEDGVLTEHIRLLDEAGLIEAMDLSSMSEYCWRPIRLTFEGHDFLAAAKNDTIWQKAKAKVLSTTGTLTLDALKLALAAAVKAAVGGGS
jgi:hypothetical protein